MPTSASKIRAHQMDKPTVDDLIWALCEVLDGERPHHFAEIFGINDEEAKRLAKIYAAAQPFWLDSLKTQAK